MHPRNGQTFVAFDRDERSADGVDMKAQSTGPFLVGLGTRLENLRSKNTPRIETFASSSEVQILGVDRRKAGSVDDRLGAILVGRVDRGE